jgi:predicted HTH domain antitoxin
MTEIVSTRVSDNMAKDLQEIEIEEKSDRATIIRKLLAKAIADWKLQRAITLYTNGKVTLWKASKIANLSLWEMTEIVKKSKISFQYLFEDFQKDFETALKEQ